MFYDEVGVVYVMMYFNSIVLVLDFKVVFDCEFVVIYLTLVGVAFLCFAGVMKAAGLGYFVFFIGEVKLMMGVMKKIYVKKVEKKGIILVSVSDFE